jgi:nicotinamide-nucleotide amidase
MKETQRSQERDADLVGAALKHGGRTLAVAESLTGGLLSSTFARASGSSQWFRGGIVAYSSAVKHDLLGVPEGPVVSEAAAVAMARGAGRLLGADVAVAVTGVGGPDPQDGEPPGTVWAAAWPDQLGEAVLLRLSGSPDRICEQVCAETARMLRERLELAAAGSGFAGDEDIAQDRLIHPVPEIQVRAAVHDLETGGGQYVRRVISPGDERVPRDPEGTAGA